MPIVGCGRARRILGKILFAVLEREYVGRDINDLQQMMGIKDYWSVKSGRNNIDIMY